MCIHLLSTFQDGNPLLKQLLSPFNKCAVNLQTELVFVLLSLVSYHCIYIYHVSVHSDSVHKDDCQPRFSSPITLLHNKDTLPAFFI